ncbi:hypothetical protein C8J57DRAFT_1514074 [Mycena rebaudengoi]|nr:hypothetical protein C8J57DRAFT_1514074 [Mycena rebaudengoi]
MSAGTKKTDDLLFDWTDRKVFAVALYSKGNWTKVIDHLKKHTLSGAEIENINSANNTTVLLSIPTEMLMAIASHSNLRDLHALARSCKAIFIIVTAFTIASQSKLVNKYNLKIEELRLTLHHTGALASGIFASVFVLPDQFKARRAPKNNVIIRVHHTSALAIECYMKVATSYHLTDRQENASGLSIDTYEHSDSSRYSNKITIEICMERQPLTELFDEMTTAHMSFISGTAAFTAYTTTLDAVALPNAAKLPLDNRDDIQSLKDLAAKMNSMGFRMASAHEEDDDGCGTHPDCPGVVRTTGDAGCFYQSFATRVLGRGPDARLLVDGNSGATWCLGGVGCTKGVQGAGYFICEHIMVGRSDPDGDL